MSSRTREEITTEIRELTKEPGFPYTFAFLVRRYLFFDQREVADMNWRERLTSKELAFVGGLLVSHDFSLAHPTESALLTQSKRIEQLLSKLHDAHSAQLQTVATLSEKDRVQPDVIAQHLGTAIRSGSSVAESVFYGSDGAYDFQYLRFARRKYAGDYAWFRQKIGFDPDFSESMTRFLMQLVEVKANSMTPPESHGQICDIRLDTFCVRLEDLKDFDPSRARAFLDRFSVKPGSVNANLELPGQFNELDARPIIRLPDGRYWIVETFLLAESIYLSPFYWMKDDPAYADSAFQNRGESTAELASELLRPVFGDQRVFRDVKIASAKGHTLTDADVLVTFGNKVLVVQAKSKKLTALARAGDDEQIRKDFKAAVQDAYEQGIVCRKAILDKQSRLIDSSGNEITLNEAINDVYLICLTSDPYPAIAHQLKLFLSKSLDDPYPVTISLFDLDVIAFYLKDPFDFLYYIRQRVALSDRIEAENEMVLLAFHLNKKLWPQHGFDAEYIAPSWAQLIDAHFPIVKGEQQHGTATDKLHCKWKNPRFERLLTQVKSSKNPGLTDAVFFLCDIAGDTADALIDWMHQVQREAQRDGQNHSFSTVLSGKKSGISYICQTSDPELLLQHATAFAMSKKYQTKSTVWLGLGAMLGSSNEIDVVLFNDDEWVEDPELEWMSRGLQPGIAINPHKNLGRNDPCHCGSGLKYKKCCGR